MGRPRRSSYVKWHMTIPSIIAARVDELLTDPLTNALVYGGRSRLVMRLLQSWLQENGRLTVTEFERLNLITGDMLPTQTETENEKGTDEAAIAGPALPASADETDFLARRGALPIADGGGAGTEAGNEEPQG